MLYSTLQPTNRVDWMGPKFYLVNKKTTVTSYRSVMSLLTEVSYDLWVQIRYIH